MYRVNCNIYRCERKSAIFVDIDFVIGTIQCKIMIPIKGTDSDDQLLHYSPECEPVRSPVNGGISVRKHDVEEVVEGIKKMVVGDTLKLCKITVKSPGRILSERFDEISADVENILLSAPIDNPAEYKEDGLEYSVFGDVDRDFLDDHTWNIYKEAAIFLRDALGAEIFALIASYMAYPEIKCQCEQSYDYFGGNEYALGMHITTIGNTTVSLYMDTAYGTKKYRTFDTDILPGFRQFANKIHQNIPAEMEVCYDGARVMVNGEEFSYKDDADIGRNIISSVFMKVDDTTRALISRGIAELHNLACKNVVGRMFYMDWPLHFNTM